MTGVCVLYSTAGWSTFSNAPTQAQEGHGHNSINVTRTLCSEVTYRRATTQPTRQHIVILNENLRSYRTNNNET